MNDKFYGVTSPEEGNIDSIRINNGILESAGKDGNYSPVRGGDIGADGIEDGAITPSKLSTTTKDMFLKYRPSDYDDFNDAVTTGVYSMASAANAPRDTGIPYWTLFVFINLPGYVSQIAIQEGSGYIYTRAKSGNTWEVWNRSATTCDQVLTIDNLDNFKTPGIYYAGAPNTCTFTPTNNQIQNWLRSDGFVLFVGNPNTVEQIAISLDDIIIRYCENDEWTQWKVVLNDKSTISSNTVSFTAAAERSQINTGESIATICSKIAAHIRDLKTVAFSGSYNDLTDKPAMLPNPQPLMLQVNNNSYGYDGVETVNLPTICAPTTLGTAGWLVVSAGSSAPIYEQPPYATCGSGRSIYDKVIPLTNFIHVAGKHIFIKFTAGNSWTGATTAIRLSINGVIRPVYWKGYPINGNTKYGGIIPWLQNDIVEFLYDGSYWHLIGVVNRLEESYINNTVAHTSNLTDSGVQIVSAYSNNEQWTKVLTIPGATKLKVTATYQSESVNYDWGCIWDSNIPTLTAGSNFSTSISGKLGGNNKTTTTYDVDGDAITVAWKSDGSNSTYYGFHVSIRDASNSSGSPEPIQLTDDNLDDIKAEGVYYGLDGNTCTVSNNNAHTSAPIPGMLSSGFMLMVHSAGDVIEQNIILYPSSKFTRIYRPTAWSGWDEIMMSSHGVGDISAGTLNLTVASSRATIPSGQYTLASLLGNMAKYLSDLKNVAFSNSYSSLDAKPIVKENTNIRTGGNSSSIFAPYYSVAIGGRSNKVGDTSAIYDGGVFCGYGNRVNGQGGVIIGGYGNSVTGEYGVGIGGYGNTALEQQVKMGHFSKSGTAGSYTGTTGDALTIGNGTSSATSNAFRVAYSGRVYGVGSFNTSGADYAEFFEWEDGNPDNEDRHGLFVTIDGDKIKIAGPNDDYILGAVSAVPGVVGNNYSENWQGMYLTDIFGRVLTQVVHHDAKYEDVMITNPETGEVDIQSVMVHGEYDAEEPILNPNYDPNEEYIPREKRKEWATVGMMGQLILIDDGTCKVNQYCKVGENGIATHSDFRSGYRVIKRLDEWHIKILFR